MTPAGRSGRAARPLAILAASALLLVGTLLAVVAAGLARSATAQEVGFRPIAIEARPIAEFRAGSDETRFGPLEFRGGLLLLSSDPHFGSLSGLDFAADGKTIYAISDNGLWFTARLIEDHGRLAGIEAGRMAPILNFHGRPLVGKVTGDAEGLRLIHGAGDAALVSFEGFNDIRRYTPFPDLAHAQAREVTRIHHLSMNKGLESVAVAPDDGPFRGAIVTIAERTLDAAGNHRAWVLSGPRAGSFFIRRTNGFDVTDAAFLPDSDLLILERQFHIASGISMRMRRIPADAIRPGTTVDGRVMLEADHRFQIDNMEGLAVRRDANGDIIILLVSDDNLSVLQRTLLLQFALKPTTTPSPRTRPAPAG